MLNEKPQNTHRKKKAAKIYKIKGKIKETADLKLH